MKLIGTSPNQVPTNGDLGDMAYQTKDSVKINGGDATLNSLLVSSISPLTDAAVDLGASSLRYRNLFLSNGAYIGGTVAANLLDDYEEGTWTPTVNNEYGFTLGTITGANGTYTKVGNVVHIRGGFTSLGSADIIAVGDRFLVSSAPFTPAGSYVTGDAACGSVFVYASYVSGTLARGTVSNSPAGFAIVIDAVGGSPSWSNDVSFSISYRV